MHESGRVVGLFSVLSAHIRAGGEDDEQGDLGVRPPRGGDGEALGEKGGGEAHSEAKADGREHDLDELARHATHVARDVRPAVFGRAVGRRRGVAAQVVQVAAAEDVEEDDGDAVVERRLPEDQVVQQRRRVWEGRKSADNLRGIRADGAVGARRAASALAIRFGRAAAH